MKSGGTPSGKRKVATEDVQAGGKKLSRGRDGKDAAAVRAATDPQRETFRPAWRAYLEATESKAGEANKKRSA